MYLFIIYREIHAIMISNGLTRFCVIYELLDDLPLLD